MKKKIVYSLALFAFLLGTNVIAEEVQQTEAQAPAQTETQAVDEQQLTVDNITEFVESDQMVPIDADRTEFVYKLKDKTGYIDQKTKFGFITNYDNITSLERFLKVSDDGKFGVIDKQGNVILNPAFQKVDMFNSDGKDYIEAKIDGKYKMYDTTGKLVPFDELFALTQNSSILLAKDLKPELKNILVGAMKKEAAPVETVEESDEITVPVVNKTEKAVETEPKAVVEETVEAAEAVAAVESNDENLITIKRKKFYEIKENGKIGVVDKDNSVIVPAKYDTYVVKTPCAHFRNPVFVVSRNNTYSIYDIKGNVLAEQVYDKINVYQKGKIYTFGVENAKGVLKVDGKALGEIEKVGDEYKYIHNKFSIFKPHKVSSLIITILNVANL